jgi:hypothetical protein
VMLISLLFLFLVNFCPAHSSPSLQLPKHCHSFSSHP